jgi:GNAT superfamily N-acetyltransferase
VRATDVRPLRAAILREGRGPDSVVWPGDDDPRSGHVLLDGVAAGSVLPQDDGSWRVRGMATAPEARGRGLGARVLSELLAHARAHGATSIWCAARPAAMSLYERAGFVAVGEPWDDPELGPHQRMELEV